MADESCQSLVSDFLQKKSSAIKNVSDEIWNNPETSWNEKHAHKVLTQFLSSEGFKVEKNFVRETGFRAVFEVSKGNSTDDNLDLVNVCFLCQYDALPDIGHGAGHNLVTAASIAAAVAVKQALTERHIEGKVTVLGTPGEDCGGGGKIEMIQARVFEEVQLCMMALPMTFNYLYPNHFRLLIVTVQYEGKAAHASAFPWEGRNALDAAVACYNNIALLRQQLKPTWMINGIITNGGTQANLIPASSELKFWIRAPTHTDMFLIQQKCSACFVAAAKATNTTAHFEFSDSPYDEMQHSEVLGEMYRKKAESVGLIYEDKEGRDGTHIGSTDMGNVSVEVPSICPTFNIGTSAVLHSPSFHDACGTPEAFEKALTAGQAMALTAVEFLGSFSKVDEAREKHCSVRRNSSSAVVFRRQLSHMGGSKESEHA